MMIDSGEINVEGITEDIKTEPIMQNGEWTFKI